MDSTHFYKNLITQDIPLRELLNNQNLFSDAPANWYVFFAEVKEPNEGVNTGKDISNDRLHNDINLAATGFIIAVLNTIKSIDKNIKVPYFFRGSGATFLIPPSKFEVLIDALENYRNRIFIKLNLILQVGHIKAENVYKDGNSIRLAKLKLNTYLVTPVVLGNGLKYAEHLIKQNFKENIEFNEGESKINLSGMECRWDEIYPNEIEKKVICLLVLCKDESLQAEVYTKIMDEIDFIFGDLNKRSPISTVRLKLDNTIRKMRKEMYVRLGKLNRSYLVQNWLITYFGKYYFKFFKDGKDYLFKVTQLSDTIVLDGSINTVFTGTERQINQFKMLLDTLEDDKEILYGMHATYASIMSCYIEDREENHIHFVDGTQGGYSNAAARLKSKVDRHQAFWN